MAQILFYHLTETSLKDALPALVEKSLARGWRATIQAPQEASRDALDAHLWAYRDESFLPHGRDGDEQPEKHPVFLTVTDANANGSQIRFLIDGVDPPDGLDAYERVMVMFDGTDMQAVEKARSDWKRLKEASHDLTYYKQSPDGKWVKAA